MVRARLARTLSATPSKESPSRFATKPPYRIPAVAAPDRNSLAASSVPSCISVRRWDASTCFLSSCVGPNRTDSRLPVRIAKAKRECEPHSHSTWRRSVMFFDRVGGWVTPAVLPHHRTYGSVYGGSWHTLEPQHRVQYRHQSQLIKASFGQGGVQMRGPGVPPGSTPIHR